MSVQKELGRLGGEVDGLQKQIIALNERIDRLMDLLSPRIEKWDKAHTVTSWILAVGATCAGGTILLLVGMVVKGD